MSKSDSSAPPPLGTFAPFNKQGPSLFDGADHDNSESSDTSDSSSMNSFMMEELDRASVDGDSVDEESVVSSLDLSMSALSSGTTDARTSKRDSDDDDDEGGENGQQQPPKHRLLQRLWRRRRKNVRSQKVSQDLKRKKQKLDKLYAEARQSYFDKTSQARFSLKNEFDCIRGFCVRFYLTLEEERLPWFSDFADPKKLRMPRKMKDVTLRLNLNIPYYSSNYLEIFYALTLPFLLVSNPVFLALLVVCCFLVHGASARKRFDNEYGDAVVILGHSMAYRTVGHVVLVLLVIAIFFFHGLQTIASVLLLNGAIILPHAIWRRTTFFDDEELEKCRPKLIQYFITIAVTMLVYLEGDPEGREADGFYAAQRRRAKLGLPILKLEDDPYIHP